MAWDFENIAASEIKITGGDTIELNPSYINTNRYSGEKTQDSLGDGQFNPPYESFDDLPNYLDGYYCEFEIIARANTILSGDDHAVFGITYFSLNFPSDQNIHIDSAPDQVSSDNRGNASLWLKINSYSSLSDNFDTKELWGNGYKRTDATSASSFGITDRYGISCKFSGVLDNLLQFDVYKNGELVATRTQGSSSAGKVWFVCPFVRPGAFRVKLYINSADMLYLPTDMLGFDGSSGSAVTPVASPFNIPISFSAPLNPNTVFPRYIPINFNDLKEFISTKNIPVEFNSIDPVSTNGTIGPSSIPIAFNSIPLVQYGFNIPLLTKSILPTIIPKPVPYQKAYSAFSYPSKTRIPVASISGYMDLREETITFTVNGIGFFDIENKESVSVYIDYKNNVDSFSVQWLNENIEALSFTEFNDINKRYSLTCRRKNYTKESAKELSIPQKTISGYTQKRGLRGIEFPEIKPFIFPGDTITINETGEQYEIKRIEFSMSAYAKTFYVYE